MASLAKPADWTKGWKPFLPQVGFVCSHLEPQQMLAALNAFGLSAKDVVGRTPAPFFVTGRGVGVDMPRTPANAVPL